MMKPCLQIRGLGTKPPLAAILPPKVFWIVICFIIFSLLVFCPSNICLPLSLKQFCPTMVCFLVAALDEITVVICYRPWYIEAVNTIGKNVVIVIDASGSMGDSYQETTVLELAKEAARRLIASLSSSDYVSCSICNIRAVYVMFSVSYKLWEALMFG